MVIVKDQSSHLVYFNNQHKHTITPLWIFELNRSSKLRDNIKRKNTFVTRRCVLSDAWFWDFKFYVWITSFSKTTPLQREPFLTMFYTINLSPLLEPIKVLCF